MIEWCIVCLFLADDRSYVMIDDYDNDGVSTCGGGEASHWQCGVGDKDGIG